MATLKEIIARTGLSESDAKQYMRMAEDKIRLYLAYREDEDISMFSSAISDVAVLLHQKKTAVDTAQARWLLTAGLDSKQYTEGQVSIRETYAGANGSAGATVSQAYDEQIQSTLNTIQRYRRARIVC